MVLKNREFFLKYKLDEYSKIYAQISLSCFLAVGQKDFDTLKVLHKKLVELNDEINLFLSKICSKDDLTIIENREYSKIPEYLVSLKIIELYRQAVVQILSGFAFDDKKNILMNKMSLYLDDSSELPYFNIAQILNKLKKYPEAVNTLQFLDELANSTPAMMFMSKLFTKLKKYDKAIECYNRYLKLYPGSIRIKNKLCKICDEVMS